jgi:glycosyltransferase involved in cell wall biosynthesis
MKKIAIVSDAVYPFNKGGKEKRLHEISTRLAAQGYAVTIYCMNWWRGAKEIQQDGVTLHAISDYYPLYAKNRRSITEAIFFSLACLKLIREDFDSIEVDHMPHLVLFTTKLVCLFKRKRMIVTWNEVWGRSYWRDYLGVIAGTVAYWVEWLSGKLPDVIISISPHTTHALRETLGATQEIVTVPIGVDSDAILKIIPAERKSDIIFAGRLLSHKNVDILLRAVSILTKKRRDFSAIIVGDGPEKEQLEKLAAHLNIQKNVSFLGFIENHDDLYALMQSSHAFVLPSTREGFGIVAIEANACGLPIITTDHEQNATKELVTPGENGALTKLDEYDLAATITTVLDSSRDHAFYRRHARKYNWSTIVAEIRKVYTLNP